MSTITTQDGTQIYFKDWGPKNAQPIVFHIGWPLRADDWDAQMLYFLGLPHHSESTTRRTFDKGYRVVAHDRRGDGRSSQARDGHDMDHYAADAAAAHCSFRNSLDFKRYDGSCSARISTRLKLATASAMTIPRISAASTKGTSVNRPHAKFSDCVSLQTLTDCLDSARTPQGGRTQLEYRVNTNGFGTCRSHPVC